ncbi:EpsG family protein [Campylobacter hyointestinalis]|uniref:EpsG family protein n=2 Tax=Campylobacter hyointestinalis TaxID=198 RepID=UPI00075138EF|nr:EpsG family protein [Campylobacter hyointestinalis]
MSWGGGGTYMMFWTFFIFLILLCFVRFKNGTYQRFTLIFALFLLFLFIGFRYEVGGDWAGYIDIYNQINSNPFMLNRDFGYYILNILAAKFGFGIVFVNVICAFIVCLFLYLSLRKLNYPFASLLYLFPFAIVVIIMGFTRQGVALSILLFGFVLFVYEKKQLAFLACVLLGGLFHSSVLLMLPFAVFGFRLKLKYTMLSYVVIGFAFISLYFYGLFDKFIYYITYNGYHSKGSIFRAGLHLLPVFIYMFYRKRIIKFDLNFALLDAMSICIAVLFILSFYLSTPVDRIMYYFYIYDIVILDCLLRLNGGFKQKIILFLLSGYTILLFGIWYFYSYYALHFWRTGSNLILEYIF